MPTTELALGVHFYQPPTQIPNIRQKIFLQCYEPFVDLLERNPCIRISMNIAYSLGEHLPVEFLGRIRELYRKGQIELVGTIAFHPLAPITSPETLGRQIKRNEEFYRDHLIGNDKLPGMFPPEMAFKQSFAALLRELGYTWCLADDGIFTHRRKNLEEHLHAPSTWIPQAHGLGVLLRSWEHSHNLAFENCVYDGQGYARNLISGMQAWLTRLEAEKNYLYMYVDGETFNHHRPDLLKRFLLPFAEEVAQSPHAHFASLDEIYWAFPKAQAYIPKSSWSTRPGQHPYHMWVHPDNEFHMLWIEFIDIAEGMAKRPLEVELAELFDRNFYSCSPWQYTLGNKDIARWCLPGFQAILNMMPEHWEKWRMQQIINRLYDLTA
jgi:alpha-amylase/alpha-mannosidase (GH57 family)